MNITDKSSYIHKYTNYKNKYLDLKEKTIHGGNNKKKSEFANRIPLETGILTTKSKHKDKFVSVKCNLCGGEHFKLNKRELTIITDNYKPKTICCTSGYTCLSCGYITVIVPRKNTKWVGDKLHITQDGTLYNVIRLSAKDLSHSFGVLPIITADGKELTPPTREDLNYETTNKTLKCPLCNFNEDQESDYPFKIFVEIASYGYLEDRDDIITSYLTPYHANSIETHMTIRNQSDMGGENINSVMEFLFNEKKKGSCCKEKGSMMGDLIGVTNNLISLKVAKGGSCDNTQIAGSQDPMMTPTISKYSDSISDSNGNTPEVNFLNATSSMASSGSNIWQKFSSVIGMQALWQTIVAVAVFMAMKIIIGRSMGIYKRYSITQRLNQPPLDFSAMEDNRFIMKDFIKAFKPRIQTIQLDSLLCRTCGCLSSFRSTKNFEPEIKSRVVENIYRSIRNHVFGFHPKKIIVSILHQLELTELRELEKIIKIKKESPALKIKSLSSTGKTPQFLKKPPRYKYAEYCSLLFSSISEKKTGIDAIVTIRHLLLLAHNFSRFQKLRKWQELANRSREKLRGFINKQSHIQDSLVEVPLSLKMDLRTSGEIWISQYLKLIKKFTNNSNITIDQYGNLNCDEAIKSCQRGIRERGNDGFSGKVREISKILLDVRIDEWSSFIELMVGSKELSSERILSELTQDIKYTGNDYYKLDTIVNTTFHRMHEIDTLLEFDELIIEVEPVIHDIAKEKTLLWDHYMYNKPNSKPTNSRGKTDTQRGGLKIPSLIRHHKSRDLKPQQGKVIDFILELVNLTNLITDKYEPKITVNNVNNIDEIGQDYKTTIILQAILNKIKITLGMKYLNSAINQKVNDALSDIKKYISTNESTQLKSQVGGDDGESSGLPENQDVSDTKSPEDISENSYEFSETKGELEFDDTVDFETKNIRDCIEYIDILYKGYDLSSCDKKSSAYASSIECSVYRIQKQSESIINMCYLVAIFHYLDSNLNGQDHFGIFTIKPNKYMNEELLRNINLNLQQKKSCRWNEDICNSLNYFRNTLRNIDPKFHPQSRYKKQEGGTPKQKKKKLNVLFTDFDMERADIKSSIGNFCKNQEMGTESIMEDGNTNQPSGNKSTNLKDVIRRICSIHRYNSFVKMPSLVEFPEKEIIDKVFRHVKSMSNLRNLEVDIPEEATKNLKEIQRVELDVEIIKRWHNDRQTFIQKMFNLSEEVKDTIKHSPIIENENIELSKLINYEEPIATSQRGGSLRDPHHINALKNIKRFFLKKNINGKITDKERHSYKSLKNLLLGDMRGGDTVLQPGLMSKEIENTNRYRYEVTHRLSEILENIIKMEKESTLLHTNVYNLVTNAIDNSGVVQDKIQQHVTDIITELRYIPFEVSPLIGYIVLDTNNLNNMVSNRTIQIKKNIQGYKSQLYSVINCPICDNITFRNSVKWINTYNDYSVPTDIYEKNKNKYKVNQWALRKMAEFREWSSRAKESSEETTKSAIKWSKRRDWFRNKVSNRFKPGNGSVIYHCINCGHELNFSWDTNAQFIFMDPSLMANLSNMLTTATVKTSKLTNWNDKYKSKDSNSFKSKTNQLFKSSKNLGKLGWMSLTGLGMGSLVDDG